MGYIRNERALKAVGLQIRKLRERAGYSQQEFADLCDMELSQINRVELGKVNTSISVIFKIAEVLKIKPSKLFEVEI
jgi:transcriptional regulator with XRE-family HTH domain